MNLRQKRLTEVEQALQAFQWHRGLDTDAIAAVSALAGLRDASVEVVRAVVVSDRHQPSDSMGYLVRLRLPSKDVISLFRSALCSTVSEDAVSRGRRSCGGG